MHEMYKDEDIILKSDYSMITSRYTDIDIIISIYENNMTPNKPIWLLCDDFRISPKEFGNIKDQLSLTLAKYVREMCSSEAINERIRGDVND